MDKTKELIRRTEEIEHSDAIPGDEEVEIDNFDGEIWICRYSEKRQSAEPIEHFCNDDEINLKELISECDTRRWYYVL